MARAPSAEYLILDIETIPDTERWQPPTVVEGEAPPRGAFPPSWAHRVVVIGCLWLDHGYNVRHLGVIEATTSGSGTSDERERALLEELADLVGTNRQTLVTFNGRSFDMPVLALRSLCLGVPMRWYYRDHATRYRYSDQGHLDLCDWLADHGATRSTSLDAVARLIGLPGKIGVDGSQVEGLYAAGQLSEIQRYCLADVAQTALLFLRFRLLQGQLAPADYRARTNELLAALAADGRVAGVLEGTNVPHLLGPAREVVEPSPEA
ncbi:MAG: ribonuclease H-like domain-containing protein [Kofleriaceae bacterium]